MNAKGSAPQLGWTTHFLSRQLVLTRDNRPFGRETRTHINDAVAACGLNAEHEISNFYSEALAQSNKLLRGQVRIDSNSDVNLCVTAKADLFNQSHNHMTMLIHNAKVSVIALRVEHAASRTLARALPFDYFQGSHYSPADNI